MMARRAARRRATPGPKTQASGSKAQDSGLKAQDSRELLDSLVFEAIDEIGAVRAMLASAPMACELARLVREIDAGVPPEGRDAVAQAAKEQFGIDIDAIVERTADTVDIGEIPNALAAAAIWRLKRLEEMLTRARRA